MVITTAPRTLIIISILPCGILGTTHARTAIGQSISTKKSSYKKDKPMTDTNAIIARSIFLYELENSMIMTKRVVSMEPHTIGISNSICNAIATPKISASEVDIDAKRALLNTGRDIYL